MNVLIVGEAGGDPAFQYGRSSERLWRWFHVKDHAGLLSLARCMNVYEKRGERTGLFQHALDIGAAMRAADIVFLVGRAAQSLSPAYSKHCFKMLWAEDRWVGLPHPSGLNRQLNGVSDATVREFIVCAMAARACELTKEVTT